MHNFHVNDYPDLPRAELTDAHRVYPGDDELRRRRRRGHHLHDETFDLRFVGVVDA